MVNNGLIAYPLIGIIGDVGVGKTLYAVDLIRKFYAQYKDTRRVFTNITLLEIPYIEINFDDFKKDDFTTKKYDLVIKHKNPESDKEKDIIREVLETGLSFEDGLLIIDEIQEGSDAYNFLNQDVQKLNHFISQVRKYDLDLIVVSQRLSFISKRLRQLLNYNFMIDYNVYYDKELKLKTFTTGIVKIRYFRVGTEGRKVYKVETKDLRGNFDFYFTKQKIKSEVKKNDKL